MREVFSQSVGHLLPWSAGAYSVTCPSMVLKVLKDRILNCPDNYNSATWTGAQRVYSMFLFLQSGGMRLLICLVGLLALDAGLLCCLNVLPSLLPLSPNQEIHVSLKLLCEYTCVSDIYIYIYIFVCVRMPLPYIYFRAFIRLWLCSIIFFVHL